MVKIFTIGEPKAVSEKLGLLLQPISEVEVEALPTDLPDKIEVNVEQLAEVNAQITVGEIKAPTGVTILTDKNQVVAKIGELISKEAAAQAAAEAAAAEAAKAATAAPAEGVTAEGEAAPAAEGVPPLRQGSAGQAKAEGEKSAAAAPAAEGTKPAAGAPQAKPETPKK